MRQNNFAKLCEKALLSCAVKLFVIRHIRVDSKLKYQKNNLKMLLFLNNSSVRVRYSNEIIPLTRDEIEKAINISENFRVFVTDKTI